MCRTIADGNRFHMDIALVEYIIVFIDGRSHSTGGMTPTIRGRSILLEICVACWKDDGGTNVVMNFVVVVFE